MEDRRRPPRRTRRRWLWRVSRMVGDRRRPLQGEQDCQAKWEASAKKKHIHIGTLFYYANQYDTNWRGDTSGDDDFQFELLPGGILTPRRQEWLWVGRIPRGTLSPLLVGLPDAGKSHIFIDMCARVSSCRAMPLDDKNEPMEWAQDVLIVCTEDRVRAHAGAAPDGCRRRSRPRITFLRYLRTSKGRRSRLDLPRTWPASRPAWKRTPTLDRSCSIQSATVSAPRSTVTATRRCAPCSAS